MASSLKNASATAGDHSTVADATYGAGTSYDWSNLGNMAASDDARAGTTALTGTDNQTHRLDIKNWGFAIPSGATIDGVEVKIEWRTSQNLRPLSEIQIRLLKAGSPVGSNKAANNTTSAVDATVTHGGSSDLWGATWDDTDVNATGFGLAVQYKSDSSSSKNPQIDHVTLEVFYTESSGGVTGTVAVTEANDTSSASGAVTATGSISVTESNDTCAASGTVLVTGSLSTTEADDTCSAAGIVSSGIDGNVTATEANDTCSASGTVTVTGSIDVMEASDTCSATGVVQVAGTFNVTEESDSCVASGTVASIISGTVNVVEEGDTCAASGTVSGDAVESSALEGNVVSLARFSASVSSQTRINGNVTSQARLGHTNILSEAA